MPMRPRRVKKFVGVKLADLPAPLKGEGPGVGVRRR
jgi:hypothetical protein